MGGDCVVLDRPSPQVVCLRLDRPRRRNAIDAGVVAALREALRSVPARVVILGSTDPTVFSAGADLGLPDTERAVLSDELYALYEEMVRHSAPLIAAVEGPAVGGGAQLALACDVRIGGPGARFRFAGVGHGLAVGAWGLPALVGAGHAADLCLSMRWVDAEQAERIGLLSRVVPDPAGEALALAEELLRCDADAIRRVKAIVRDAHTLERLAAEREGNRLAWDGSIGAARLGEEHIG
jgi:enoyl-CoA hydratase/carnithine racemase